MSEREKWLVKLVGALVLAMLGMIAWWARDIDTKVDALLSAQAHNEEFHFWTHPPGPPPPPAGE